MIIRRNRKHFELNCRQQKASSIQSRSSKKKLDDRQNKPYSSIEKYLSLKKSNQQIFQNGRSTYLHIISSLQKQFKNIHTSCQIKQKKMISKLNAYNQKIIKLVILKERIRKIEQDNQNLKLIIIDHQANHMKLTQTKYNNYFTKYYSSQGSKGSKNNSKSQIKHTKQNSLKRKIKRDDFDQFLNDVHLSRLQNSFEGKDVIKDKNFKLQIDHHNYPSNPYENIIISKFELNDVIKQKESKQSYSSQCPFLNIETVQSEIDESSSLFQKEIGLTDATNRIYKQINHKGDQSRQNYLFSHRQRIVKRNLETTVITKNEPLTGIVSFR